MTLTLDANLAAQLNAEARRTGRSLRDLANAALRRGLLQCPTPTTPFKVAVRDLGNLQSGVSLDKVALLIEQVEGPPGGLADPDHP